MDEREIEQKRRDNEEQATRERAKILGLPYLDAREFEDTVPLIKDLISKKVILIIIYMNYSQIYLKITLMKIEQII